MPEPMIDTDDQLKDEEDYQQRPSFGQRLSGDVPKPPVPVELDQQPTPPPQPQFNPNQIPKGVFAGVGGMSQIPTPPTTDTTGMRARQAELGEPTDPSALGP